MASSAANALPRWKASTAYAAGDIVVAPDGFIVERITAGASGTTYSATNWKTNHISA